jgi:hypothetical protein
VVFVTLTPSIAAWCLKRCGTSTTYFLLFLFTTVSAFYDFDVKIGFEQKHVQARRVYDNVDRPRLTTGFDAF